MRGRQNGVRSCVELAMQGVFREQHAMSSGRNIENLQERHGHCSRMGQTGHVTEGGLAGLACPGVQAVFPLTPEAPELSVGGGGKRPWLDGLPACEEPPVRKKKPHPHLPGWKQSISSTKSTSPDYFLPSAKLVCHSRGGLGWDIHES